MKSTRVIYSLLVLLAAFVLGVPRAGFAQAKPKLAVLGLEVTGDVAPANTEFAKNVTNGLRSQPVGGLGPYTATVDTARELIDMKVTHDCLDDVSAACLGKMARELKVDFLVWGTVTRSNNQYNVQLQLFETASLRTVNRVADTVALNDSNEGAAKQWGKTFYAKLTGMAIKGILVVRSNEPGIVSLDGKSYGAMKNGSMTIGNIDDGTHALRVEGDGKAFSTDVEMSEGKRVEVEAKMESTESKLISRGGTVSRTKKRTGAKVMMFGGLAVAAVGGVVWYLNYASLQDLEQEILQNNAAGKKNEVGFAGCILGTPEIAKDLKGDPCGKQRMTGVGMAMVGVGALVAGIGGYYAYGKADSADKVVGSKRTPRKRFTFTPVVAPQSSGAMVRIDF